MTEKPEEERKEIILAQNQAVRCADTMVERLIKLDASPNDIQDAIDLLVKRARERAVFLFATKKGES